MPIGAVQIMIIVIVKDIGGVVGDEGFELTTAGCGGGGSVKEVGYF